LNQNCNFVDDARSPRIPYVFLKTKSEVSQKIAVGLLMNAPFEE